LVTRDESKTYEDLAGWIKRTNREVHVVHGTAQSKEHPKTELPSKSLWKFTPKVDGNLSEWPQETAIKPSAIMSLREDAVLDHTYFISYDADSLYVAGDVSDSHLENPGGDWFLTGDSFFLHLSSQEAHDLSASRDLSLFICPVGSGPSKNEPFAVRWHGHERSMAIPAVIVNHSTRGRLRIEAKILWASLEGFAPWHSCPLRMRVGYQNANGICQAHWNGIILFQAP
jgi:hypothetical protein